MAEWQVFDDGLYQQPAPPEEMAPVSDTGRTLQAGAHDIGTMAGSLLRAGGERTMDAGGGLAELGRYLQDYHTQAAEAATEQMSPAGKARLEAPISSDAFLDHPFSSIGLKITRGVPSMAAIVLPSLLSGGTLDAAILGGVAGGTMSAAQAVDQIQKNVDAKSDADLRASDSYYDSLRDMGMDEKAARAKYDTKIMGLKPSMAFIAGAVTGVVGPAGQAARALKGGTAALGAEGKGILGRAATGAAEGAATQGAQAAGVDATVQAALMEGNLQKQYDPGQTALAGGEGAIVGGAMSLPFAPLGGGRAKPKQPAKGIHVLNEGEVPADVAAALPKQPELGASPNPQPEQTQPVAGTPPEQAPQAPPTVPEGDATLRTQQAQMLDEDHPRKAMWFPAGTPELPVPEGIKRIQTPEGVLHYDPEEITTQRARKALQAGKLNELLDLGPVTKEEAVARAAGGEQPVAVTTRTPEGVETKAAAGTTVTAPDQIAAQEATKGPGEVVNVERPEDVLAGRQAPPPGDQAVPTGRILPDLTQPKEEIEAAKAAGKEFGKQVRGNIREMANEEKLAAQKEAGEKTGHRTEEEKAAASNRETVGAELFKKYAPGKGEDDAATIARARAIVADADAAGVKILKSLVGKGHSPQNVVLTEAKNLVQAANSIKGDALAKRVVRFRTREDAARSGAVEEALNDRRLEAEEVNKTFQGDVELKGATPDAEKDQVATVVTKSAQGMRINERTEQAEVKTKSGGTEKIERAQAASPVRKVTLTPEELAKYNTQGIGPKAAEKIAQAKAPVEKKAAPPVEVAEKPKTTQRAPARDLEAEIARARNETDINPSDRQKETGQYKKGRIEDFHGMTVELENPKGSIRSGKDPNGKPWAVKMPYDYGEIVGTKGADGDRLDIAIGPHPESKHVFVFDQKDLKTGEFDEHKPFFGYNTLADAMKAYDAGFSDGRGMERIQNATAMTVDEFNARRAKGEFKKRLPQGVTALSAALRPVGIGQRGAYEGVVKMFRVGGTGLYDVPVLHSTTVKSLLTEMQQRGLKDQGMVHTALSKLLVDKMIKLAGDVPVHTVSNEVMATIQNEHVAVSHLEGTRGEHVVAKQTGEQYITIRADQLKNPIATEHAVLHEIAHAITVRAIFEDPRLRATVQQLLDETKAYAKSLPKSVQEDLRYALTKPTEFIAEAYSNPKVQNALALAPLSDKMARQLGLGARRSTSVWDALIGTVRKIIEKVVGPIPDGHRMIEAVLRVGEQMDVKRQAELFRKRRGDDMEIKGDLGVMREALKTQDVKNRAIDLTQKTREVLDKVSFLRDIGLRARRAGMEFAGLFNRPIRLKGQMEAARAAILEHGGGQRLVRRLADIERNYKEQPEKVAGMFDVAFDASRHQLELGPSAKNEFGKDRMDRTQAQARLPELQARYAALPADMREWLHDAAAYFKGTQDAISHQLIKNILDKGGLNDPALTKRVFEGAMTDADKELAEKHGLLAALQDVRQLRQLKGWYFPFRRYGDFVATGRYELKAPANAIKVGHDSLVFANPNNASAARREAKAYVQRKDTLTHIATRKIWVDKNELAKGKVVELPSDDLDAIGAYKVTLQTQHTEFHDTESAARQAVADMREAGLADVQEVGKRADYAHRASDMMSAEMQRVLNSLVQQERYKKMTPQAQAALKQALVESSVRVLGSTRLQSGFLHRRNVVGESHDLMRVTAEYARTAAGYLARLQHQDQLDAAFKAVQDYQAQHLYDKERTRRDELINELRKRLYDDPAVAEVRPSTLANAVSRALQWSRLDKLGGVSFHVINAQEPLTTALPVIGGRHGFARSAAYMARAYNTIGGARAVVAGAKDTAGAFLKDNGFADYAKMFKAEIDKSLSLGQDAKTRLKDLIDFLGKEGAFHDDAIFELSRHADPSSNIIGRGLDRADLMANQMGNAVEKINRTVTALTAYELEYRQTHSHEAAKEYAFEVTHTTMGDYSGWNTPNLAKSTSAGRLAFQFKKFALKQYSLLGRLMYDSIKGDPQAIKQFVGLMVAHQVVAGALGLPWEPVKLAILPFTALGLFSYDDFEAAVRAKAAEALGATGGEVFSRGLTRLIGVETSQRQGLSSMAIGNTPKNNDPKEWATFLYGTIAGAPGSIALDMVRLGQAIQQGNAGKIAEYLVPLKAWSDLVKAGTGLNPPPTKSGRPGAPPLTPAEAAVQAVGFTPASRSEFYERNNNFYGKSKAQDEQRKQFYAEWAQAKTADERAKLRGKIEAWNAQRPPEARIKPADLERNRRTREKEERNGTVTNGMRVNKRDRYIRDEADKTYNAPKPDKRSEVTTESNKVAELSKTIEEMRRNQASVSDLASIVKLLGHTVKMASAPLRIVRDPKTGLATGFEPEGAA